MVWFGPKSNSSQLLCLFWLPATVMMIWSKMNELAWRPHFPIISLWDLFYTSRTANSKVNGQYVIKWDANKNQDRPHFRTFIMFMQQVTQHFLWSVSFWHQYVSRFIRNNVSLVFSKMIQNGQRLINIVVKSFICCCFLFKGSNFLKTSYPGRHVSCFDMYRKKNTYAQCISVSHKRLTGLCN